MDTHEHRREVQPMTNPLMAADALKYAAALLKHRTDWATDAIGGAGCGGDHDTELEALDQVFDSVEFLATQFGDPNRYSDGRQVVTSREIERGFITVHVWHPLPEVEAPASWRGNLRHDPGEPCPGLYEVSTTPDTQEIHVRVVRTA